MGKIAEYKFEVETIESGQRGAYQDSFYSYHVTSNVPDYMVKAFCMNVLSESYKREDMPSAFAGEFLEFKSIRENTYSYKYKRIYTD